MSPYIHKAFGTSLNMSLAYTIEDVDAMTFAAKIAELQTRGFSGCNITVPYKENAFSLADICSERAKRGRAANTFVFQDKRIYADNTDGIGFIRDLTQNLSYPIRGKSILICGAGGAIRGVLPALLKQDPGSIIIANRTIHKAQALIQELVNADVIVEAKTYAELSNTVFDLVIDGTSSTTEMLPLPSSISLSSNSLVYDLKYGPAVRTLIMAWGSSYGARVANGIGMLVEQAAEAFRLWSGKMPETGPVIALMQQKFYSSKKISLIGAMAAGKTTVGQKLAQKFALPFYDTDAIIVNKTGLSILEIFARYGESKFRELETQVLEALFALPGPAVIATGGGIISNAKNRKLLQEHSQVIFLDISVQEQLQRTENDLTRPLLVHTDKETTLTLLRAERLSLYQQISDHCLYVDGLPIDVIISELVRTLYTLQN